MISFEEAYESFTSRKTPISSEQIDTGNALGRILSSKVLSELDHPYMNVSAVDGYAFKWTDELKALKLSGEIPAGGIKDDHLPNHCVRIYTGAALPSNCDTVIMQEHVEFKNELVNFQKEIKRGANVRMKAEQIAVGDLLFKEGHRLNSASLALLKTLGVRELSVYRKIKIKLIVTGSEFTESRKELTQGKIFESNSVSVIKSLENEACEIEFKQCIDDLKELSQLVSYFSEDCDLMLLTGGVSVGDYDFTRSALENNGFDVIFHKVRQKPGKPLLFAQKDKVLALGLPGNPRAVHVALEVYVKDWIRKNLGGNSRKRIYLPLSKSYSRKADRAEFLSCSYSKDGIEINEKQGSHMLASFAKADFLAYFSAEKNEFEAKELIECIDLRNGN